MLENSSKQRIPVSKLSSSSPPPPASRDATHNRRTRLFTDEMLRCNSEAAQRHGVEAACHPADFIYEFVVRHPSFSSIKQAVDYYFDDGARSAAKFEAIVRGLAFPGHPLHILEFASGYGCVTRHLKRNQAWSLVACDIHSEAVEFLRNKLGVRALMSVHAPEDLSLDEKFDVIFALSFFSHMPRVTWGRWVKALFHHLKCPGYLVFTTHGLASRKAHGDPEIPIDGFWFTEMSEQHDLSRTEYGSTIVTPEFVMREVCEQTGEQVFDYKHAFWWDHQDLWVVKKKDERSN